MAESVLSFAIEEMLRRVSSLAAHGIMSLAWGFKGKLKKLEESLLTIQEVLQDAKRREVPQGSMGRWLEKLQDVAYDAEDVLDEFNYEILRQKVEIQNSLKGKVRSFFSLSNPVAFRLHMALKIEKINESLDEIKSEAASWVGFRIISVATAPQPTLNLETDSFLGSSEVVIGRNDDVSKLMSLLSSSCNQQDLAVIPIVGMGGLGKTTLAKAVHKEVKERKSFDVTFWICVSDSFDDKRILGEMLQTFDERTGGISGINSIMTHLQKKLKEKKFLLILDDVWNEEPARWDSLKRRLLEISEPKRNAIIVTTRSSQVASMMESSPGYRHELKKLSDGECWSIIRKLVVRDGEQIPLELESIGRDIAKKSRGVPLAAKVLGGMMFSEKQKEKWLSIKQSDALDALRHNDEVLPILKLSFNHLSSPSLQRCFAYCSIFPKDFEIGKEQLVQLWMAEGLLVPSHERVEAMEDIGDRYFNYLVGHSFFQDIQTDEFDNIIQCKMHDLVHDLALLVSKSETLILETGSAINDTFHARHLNLVFCGIDEQIFLKDGVRKLRTLFARVDVLNKSCKFRGLRTLNLCRSDVKDLPAAIGKLKQLRYLDVSRTEVKEFPESIMKLYLLQTLRFFGCDSLVKLPIKMRSLMSLRHIDFSHMPANVGCLTGLQALPFFDVGQDKGKKIEELGCLKDLGGKLKIGKLEHVRDKEEAKRANLRGKAKVKTLVLEWSPWRECSNDKDVLEGLQPHTNLRSLKIRNYKGSAFPQWLLKPALDHLVVLKLIDSKKCKELPTLEHLSNLKIVEIERIYGVECIGMEFYGSDGSDRCPIFPALKRLSLKGMSSVVEWMIPQGGVGGEGEGDAAVVFPCLEELFVEDCRDLKSIPLTSHPGCGSFSNLMVMKLENCNDCEQLPALGHLPRLEILEIVKMNCVRCIGSEFYGGSSRRRSEMDTTPLFPALKRLSLKDMDNLVKWIVPAVDDGVLQVIFPCLEELCIGWCGKLETIPSMTHLSSKLVKFEINRCGKLSHLHGEFHASTPSLNYLSLYNCDNLQFIPSLQHCKTLVQLEMSCCGSLSYIPEDFFCGLTQLKKLEIGGFSQELETFPAMDSIQCLSSSLEDLKIIGWKKLKSIPHQLQGLTSLKKLKIQDFIGEEFEEALPDWLGNLSSLEELRIWMCPNVKYLPSSTAMQRLSKLTNLRIYDCSLLWANGTKDSERSTISHIPEYN